MSEKLKPLHAVDSSELERIKGDEGWEPYMGKNFPPGEKTLLHGATELSLPDHEVTMRPGEPAPVTETTLGPGEVTRRQGSAHDIKLVHQLKQIPKDERLEPKMPTPKLPTSHFLQQMEDQEERERAAQQEIDLLNIPGDEE